MSMKGKILDQLGEETFELNQILDNRGRKLMKGNFIEKLKDVVHQTFFLFEED